MITHHLKVNSTPRNSLMLKKPLLFISLVVLLHQVNAQVDSCINYFTGNSIYSLVEYQNAIWFATECRLVEFSPDSNQLRFHSHKNTTECVRYANLRTDAIGNLWAEAAEGIYRYNGEVWQLIIAINGYNYPMLLGIDRHNQVWYRSDSLYKHAGSNSKVYPLKQNITQVAFDSLDNLWATSSFGLVKLKDSVVHIYNKKNTPLPDNYLRAILIDKSNKMWLSGHKQNGLNPDSIFMAQFDGDNWIIHTTSTGLPDIGTILQIREDVNQQIWCVGKNGVATYDGMAWTLVKKREEIINNDADYRELLIDKMNNKWLATNGNGLFKQEGNSWKQMETSNSGLSGNAIVAIEADRNNKIWVSTDILSGFFSEHNRGFVSFDDTNWVNYSYLSNPGMPSKPYAMTSDSKKNIWAADERSLYKYDGLNWEKYPTDLSSNISIATDSDNHVWVISSGKPLRMYDGINWTYYPSEAYGFPFEEEERFWNVVGVDLNNNVWLGVSTYLYRFDRKSWQAFSCKRNNGYSCWYEPIAMAFDKNNHLWLACRSEGLIRFDGVNFYTYKSTNKYDNYPISLCIDDDNNVWMGTLNTGLIKYDGKHWVKFNTKNANILNNRIYAIKYLNKQLWVGTEMGLIKFNECGGDTITVNTEMFTGSLEYPEQTFNIHTYPNPVGSSLTIACQEKALADIYNIHGQLVTSIVLENQTTELNLSDFPSGFYILQVKANKGLAVRKIIKQ